MVQAARLPAFAWSLPQLPRPIDHLPREPSIATRRRDVGISLDLASARPPPHSTAHAEVQEHARALALTPPLLICCPLAGPAMGSSRCLTAGCIGRRCRTVGPITVCLEWEGVQVPGARIRCNVPMLWEADMSQRTERIRALGVQSLPCVRALTFQVAAQSTTNPRPVPPIPRPPGEKICQNALPHSFNRCHPRRASRASNGKPCFRERGGAGGAVQAGTISRHGSAEEPCPARMLRGARTNACRTPNRKTTGTFCMAVTGLPNPAAWSTASRLDQAGAGMPARVRKCTGTARIAMKTLRGVVSSPVWGGAFWHGPSPHAGCAAAAYRLEHQARDFLAGRCMEHFAGRYARTTC